MKLYKKAWYIQHKVAHLAMNIMVLSGNKEIPLTYRKRLRRISESMFDLAKINLKNFMED